MKRLLSDLLAILTTQSLSVTLRMLFPLALASWEEWKIWRRRSYIIVKLLLDNSMKILISQMFFINLVALFSGAFTSWGGWRIRRRQSHAIAKLLLSNLIIILIVHLTNDHHAGGLCTRFDQLGRMEDLEEAITCHRQALILLSYGHRFHSVVLSNIGRALLARFHHLERTEDLEDAIACNRQALTLLPAIAKSLLSYLIAILIVHFTLIAFRVDYALALISWEGWRIWRRQLHVTAKPLLSYPLNAIILDNFSNAVLARFYHLERMEDLEDAIACSRQALTLFPHGHHHNYSTILNTLANALSNRYHRLGSLDDLEVAITCLHQALDLEPQGHPYRSSTLFELARALTICSKQSERVEDLEEAITYYGQALALQSHGHLHRPSTLENLALAVFARYRYMQSRNKDDLSVASKYLSEAKKLLPTAHPHQSGVSIHIASVLLAMSKLEDFVPDEIESNRHQVCIMMALKAFELLEQAADDSSASAKDRLMLL